MRKLIFMHKSGHGYPLIFFHGWGFDHRIWFVLLPQLNDFYTCYLVDLPGFGQTVHMSWQEFNQQLLKLLPKKFAVLGWSLGGLYALRLLLAAHEHISHLLLVATSPCFIANVQWPGISRPIMNNFIQSFHKQPQQTILDFIKLQLDRSESIEMNNMNYAALADGLQILSTWDLRSLLIQYERYHKKPICCIFGKRDKIITYKTMTAMHEIYPSWQYNIINNAAHMPFLTMDFITILRGFIQ